MTSERDTRETPLALVVDDDPSTRLLVRVVLEESGFAVAESGDGVSGLRVFRESCPDVVLLDVMLPDMDGLEVCTAMRRFPDCEQVPVIIMTSLDDISSIERAYESGATDFITKPFNLTVLAHRARYMLHASRSLESLKWSEASRQALLNVMPDAMLRIGRDGLPRVHSRTDMRRGGTVAGQSLALSLYDVLPPEIVPHVIPLVARALETRNLQEFECQHTVEGEDKRYEVRIVVYGEDEALAIVRETTERNAFEKALRQSEEKYRELFEDSHDLIQSTGVKGEFRYVNRAWRDAFGYDESDLKCLSVFDLVSPEMQAPCREAFARAQAGQRVDNFGTVLVTKDRRYIVVEGSLTPGLADGRAGVTWCILRDITERKRSEEQIVKLAYHDSLTRLPNRLLFRDRLRQALAYAERMRTMFATLFLDLDRFKRINDTLGHCVGDELLQGVADRLAHILRRNDCVIRPDCEEMGPTVARLGGDEFTILLTDIKSVKDVARVARRIIDDLSKPFVLKRHEVFVTTSLGISVFPFDGSDEESLLKHADMAMYHAKELGRNNFQFYRAGIGDVTSDRIGFENDIRRGLERGEFTLHYQPRVAVRSGRIACIEALLRWEHPERGLVSTSEFISVAEGSGLIVPLGEWALFTACEKHKSLMALDPSLRLSVNVSPQQLRHHSLTEAVSRAILESGLDPRSLELELMESTLMGSSKTSVRHLEELRDLGIRLSIDDFGVGYSSLRRLRSLPIDMLKIDQSYVRDVASHSDAAAITRAIIAMAHSLNLSVVAEGVEHEDQLAFLAEHGCDEVQGYLVSPPLKIETLEGVLAGGRHAIPQI
ncbi:MAG: EAL domain-containing protein [Chloroflexota bacterium]